MADAKQQSSTSVTNSTAKPAGKCPFPFARPFAAHPPVEYAKLREEDPIPKVTLFDGSEATLITRHKDVKSVLEDTRFSKVRTAKGFPELSAGGRAAAAASRTPTFVDMDPPEHTKYRGMIEAAFTKDAAEALRPDINKIVDQLIDDIEAHGSPVNLIEALSLPLTFKVIFKILGIPDSDYAFLSKSVAVRATGSSTAKDAATAAQDVTDYMERLVTSKEEAPADDLISQIVLEQLRPGHITHDQLVQTAFLMLVAGNATVATMINVGVVTLLQHPDQLAALKADPEGLLENAVDEIMRFHTASAYALKRLAKEDVELDGQVIKAGEGIIALNQSANRDATVFNNPDTFDIRRPNANENVAFGYGIHLCPAMWLSRVEVQAALGGLFRRLPNLALTVPPAQLKWSDPKKDIGLAELIVKF